MNEREDWRARGRECGRGRARGRFVARVTYCIKGTNMHLQAPAFRRLRWLCSASMQISANGQVVQCDVHQDRIENFTIQRTLNDSGLTMATHLTPVERMDLEEVVSARQIRRQTRRQIRPFSAGRSTGFRGRQSSSCYRQLHESQSKPRSADTT